MKAYWGSGGLSPCILNIGIEPLYSRGRSPRYPLDRELCGFQRRSGRRGDKNHHCLCRESNIGDTAISLVSILTELSQLLPNISADL